MCPRGFRVASLSCHRSNLIHRCQRRGRGSPVAGCRAASRRSSSGRILVRDGLETKALRERYSSGMRGCRI